jgi:hypothetical protein
LKLLNRNDLTPEYLPGRVVMKAVGKDGPSVSGRISMGFAHYSSESGPMEPHNHAEEVCYVVDSVDGWFRYGPSPDKLSAPIHLETGMILHNPPLEYHVFEYGNGGHVDIIFIYGQVDNIRPEEITAK